MSKLKINSIIVLNFFYSARIKAGSMLIAFFLCQCSKPVVNYPLTPAAQVQVQRSISNVMSPDSIELCNLFVGKWDSILVVNPYAIPNGIKNLDVSGYSAVKSLVNDQSHDDMNCTLLFIDNKTYVGFNVLTRSFIDFAPLAIAANKQFIWIEKRECKNFKFLRSKVMKSLVVEHEK
ncbi:hypothetical protein [Hymenobacter cheonanensis]|uniref:hypothetical protein n=1 Tax=Hymenobacter sp. CA2-7 TaxID=3063993 RepID=UPI0027135CCF|nr:hypothetical protein [Hymenobacter sp. CA2-7]MDO7887200.1 hypothetical protein [Hymenobacter sp. CA2-7]